MTSKRLAVIILNWNGEKLLRQFLPDAAKYTIDEHTDLIVADNGSTDGSLDYVRSEFPQVKVIAFDRNHGFAEGYNLAVEQTGYEYTLLLNSDVEVTPGWTAPLLAFMDANPHAGACQPKIRSYRQKELFEYAGAAGGFLDRHGYPYCRGRLFAEIESDKGQYDDAPARIAWASGAAMMTRTRAYLECGGLDSRFFAHMEEIDLCCRMQAKGWTVWAVPGSVVFHVGGASLPKDNPRKTYLNFRNNLLLLHKNMPRREGRRLLIVRRLLDTLAFGMFVAKLDFANAGAVLKAHRDFRTMKRQYTELPDRNFLRTLPGADRDILIDYYIKHHKK